MTFSAAALKIAPCAPPRPFSRPSSRPPGPYAPFKESLSLGEIGRLSTDYRPGCLRVGEARRDVSVDSATRHAGNCHGGIATSITAAPSNLPSFAALLGRAYRRRQAISDEPRGARCEVRGASCEMGGRPL